MSRKSSQKRIEANRRNALKSTGPRTPEGKAKSAGNSTTHGFSRSNRNPLAPGTFLHTEDQAAFQGLLDEYIATYNPQHRDEHDLLAEAVYAKWCQQRMWVAETNQLEVTIALHEADLQKALPRANASAHLAGAVEKSEAVLKLYLRYDAQLRRHYRQCLQDLRDLQAERTPPEPDNDDSPSEPNHPDPEPTPEAPNEPKTPELPPEQAAAEAKKAAFARHVAINLGILKP